MRKTFTAAALLAAFGACGLAAAQNNDPLYPSGITARVGVAFPLDKTLTNVGSVLGNVGVEFNMRPLLRTGESYFAIDYFFRAFSGNSSGSVLPITVNHRMFTSEFDRRSYYFFGLGVSFINVRGNGAALTGRFGVGMELGPAVITEAALYVSGHAGGARANALTVNIGYKF